MTSDNPFAPPAQEHGAFPTETGAAVFSDEGSALVGSLARWMQFVGMFYLVLASLIVLAVLAMFAIGTAPGTITLAIGAPIAIAVIAAGVWLREAGGQFNRGVTENDLGILGVGFGTLRKYLVLVGVLGILQVANTLVGVIL